MTTGEKIQLPERLKPLAREIRAFLRELPRLVAEGEEGRVALVKGDEVISVWDTKSDAMQAGCERFGLEPFLTQPIDSRDIDRLANLDV